MTNLVDDPYPTRQPTRRPPIMRREPVIHDRRGTRTPGPLSREQLARFERDGFLVLENYLTPRDVWPFINDLDDYQRDGEVLALPQVITERDTDAIRSIFGVHRLSKRFDALTRSPRLRDMAEQLLGSDVYVHQSRLNRKPAFRGRGFDWHSDFETWHAEDGMPAMRCVSISVSLTENNDTNGPLLLIPGSHHAFYPTVGATPDRYWETSLKQQSVGIPSLADLEDATRDRGVVPVRGGLGTVTLFDCNTLHASSDNLSPEPRPNLFFVYNSLENALQAPFAAGEPRPEWLATRQGIEVRQRQPQQRIA